MDAIVEEAAIVFCGWGEKVMSTPCSGVTTDAQGRQSGFDLKIFGTNSYADSSLQTNVREPFISYLQVSGVRCRPRTEINSTCMWLVERESNLQRTTTT